MTDTAVDDEENELELELLLLDELNVTELELLLLELWDVPELELLELLDFELELELLAASFELLDDDEDCAAVDSRTTSVGFDVKFHSMRPSGSSAVKR